MGCGLPSANSSRRGRQRHLMIVERPFLHVADAGRSDAVEDELGVVDPAQVLAEQRIAVPDVLKDRRVGDDLRRASDADLVVLVVEELVTAPLAEPTLPAPLIDW